ncbi:MAG: cytochrome c biogenesis heme-transporting ATPase CcmA [Gammaproteobacteria bacterium]|nr:cytochrome c biogenesis heme-transporting ATPase CcmA [Gammaproteobacteria bacterium]
MTLTGPPLLAATNLHLWRGDRHVLRGVSLGIRSGEALHVWGPNGAGKTSLLRVICGLLHAEEGEVTWNALPIQQEESRYLEYLSYLAHDTALKGDLTALENLQFSVGLRRDVEPAELRAMLEDLEVEHCADLPCRVLSAGQKRRVALARVLLSRSAFWVLDEPFTNLDAASSERVSRALGEHLARGGLALIAAHQGLDLRAGTVTRLGLT